MLADAFVCTRLLNWRPWIFVKITELVLLKHPASNIGINYFPIATMFSEQQIKP